MDVVIQSQIQSPLVRTLQSIPSNSSNFVHGIPDNTPPFSKHNVSVEPSSGSDTNLRTTYVFKIPQGGHISRMYLEHRMYGVTYSDVDNNPNRELDSPFNFGNSIEWVELRTHNNVIERLYPSSIVFLNASLASSDQALRYIMQGTSGYYALHDSNYPLEPPTYSEPLRLGNDRIGNLELQQFNDFLVFLPFSMCLYLKDNFQTRMMEDMEIAVKMRPTSAQLSTPLSVHDPTWDTSPTLENRMKLRIDFLNFHENVEEVIRNENFKPNIPAALLSNDCLKFVAKFKSKEEKANFDQATYLYTVDLSCDALVTNIFINSMKFPDSRSYRESVALTELSQHFRLLSGSEVIWEGSKAELDGIQSLNYSTVTRQYQNEGTLSPRWESTGTNMRLSLNNTDEYFDGGISFQSLVNPTLEIRVTGVKTSTGFTLNLDEGLGPVTVFYSDKPENVEFDVVLKRKVMLRIDGNTGKIQKSLES